MEFPIPLKQKYLEKAEKLRVFPNDIEEKFVRGSGSGGQKMNKTASTVWLKHGPSGLEVKVQNQRELISNRIGAYKLLILKIEEKVLGKKSEMAQKVFKLRKQKKRRTRRAQEKLVVAKRLRGELKQSRSSAVRMV